MKNTVFEPILSPGFLKWIKSNNFSNKVLLEIGAGSSTVFFSKYFKKVYSFENDLKEYNKIKEYNLTNVDIQLFDKGIFYNTDFKNKINISDIIFIDNNPHYIPRSEFAHFAHLNRKNKSIIVLDNGEWNIEAYEFLRSKYYCVDYLRRNIKEGNKLTQTTVFYNLRNKK